MGVSDERVCRVMSMLPCRVYLIRQTNIAFSLWWSEETRKQSALVYAVEGSGGEGRRVWVYLFWVAVKQLKYFSFGSEVPNDCCAGAVPRIPQRSCK